MPTAAEFEAPARPQGGGLLAGMRIRKKLIVLHTCFSLALATILFVAMRPAISEVVRQGELHEAELLLRLAMASPTPDWPSSSDPNQNSLTIERGERARRVIPPELSDGLKQSGEPAIISPGTTAWLGAGDPPILGTFDRQRAEFITASVRLQGARDAVQRLYMLFALALLAVYGLVAMALELFVLPKAVYQPIRTMLEADEALRAGRRDDEIIATSAMPADELGAIMRSRNASVTSLRRHEADLADALRRLEEVASDLARKNHLLEMARKNLADADRLASLGMMSAGVAHELNTPLAVIKGLAERLTSPASTTPDGRQALAPDQAALLLRVVGRLERLGESLLDFARVRPPTSVAAPVRPMLDEAWTLVRLDRGAGAIEFANTVPPEVAASCDPDRIVQVFVNILRNAIDASSTDRDASSRGVRISATASLSHRDQSTLSTGDAGDAARPTQWITIAISDNGPGIPPELLGRLFEPFVSSRLDSNGTGLGLAVAEGIVREHGGMILARNRTDSADPSRETGAVFEIMLPAATLAVHSTPAPGAHPTELRRDRNE